MMFFSGVLLIVPAILIVKDYLFYFCLPKFPKMRIGNDFDQ